MKAECVYFPYCTGCQHIGQDIESQKAFKMAHFKKQAEALLQDSNAIGWISVGHFGLRDRLDFIYEQGRLGLYSTQKKKVIDLATCGQLSPNLSSWHHEFRKFKWPIKKGSIRLRISPDGQKGVWLDFANEDIKALLSEKILLSELMHQAVVEIGQKRKTLKNMNGELKLKDPEALPWFESIYLKQSIPLYCHIGSFTQPSLKANKALLTVLSDWVRDSGLKYASEFGSGIGNISVAILPHIIDLNVFENDALSVECFKKTLNSYPHFFSNNKINFHVGNYQKQKQIIFKNDEILVVNPPRSGLKEFLLTLKESLLKPKVLIYMSCFVESWAQDGKALSEMGYTLTKISLIDQFPQTDHYEILSYWVRDKESILRPEILPAKS